MYNHVGYIRCENKQCYGAGMLAHLDGPARTEMRGADATPKRLTVGARASRIGAATLSPCAAGLSWRVSPRLWRRDGAGDGEGISGSAQAGLAGVAALLALAGR